jgi:two-component system response regulator HydG
MIRKVAASTATVLVTGESGTGKELIAQSIHRASPRRDKPLVAINCAAMPEALLESELFGHARGAFTDARTQRDGLFIEANNGTIFLDEIGDLPLELQPKLLRALQERRIRRVGSNTEVPFNARLVTATHRNLEEEVRARRFREDLFYRINVITIDVPALRDRGNDVIELATHFLAQIGARNGVPALKLSPTAAQQLLAYPWPGNVRELENCMERAVVLARLDEIGVADLPEKVRTYRKEPRAVTTEDPTEVVTVAELEKRHVLRVLSMLGGNKVRAAQVLGLDRKTLYRKLQR